MRKDQLSILATGFLLSILIASYQPSRASVTPEQNFDSIPLSVTMGQDVMICEGQTVQIFGEASGGTGNYDYSWSPEEFLSDPNIADPFAFPDSSKFFTLTISDGVSSVSDSLLITVFYCPHPEIIAIPNDTVGINDTILLFLGDGYLAYFWMDGMTDTLFTVTNQNGPSGGEQVYWVTVFSAGGCSGHDTISVWFLPEMTVPESMELPDFRIISQRLNESVSISCSSYEGVIYTEVIALSGECLFNGEYYLTPINPVRLSTSGLPSGIYVIRVRTERGEVWASEKILK